MKYREHMITSKVLALKSHGQRQFRGAIHTAEPRIGAAFTLWMLAHKRLAMRHRLEYLEDKT